MTKQKAAELRRDDARKRRRALYRMTILVLADEDGGHVEVSGMPDTFEDAWAVMNAAFKAVVGGFMRRAMEEGKAPVPGYDPWAEKAGPGPVNGLDWDDGLEGEQ